MNAILVCVEYSDFLSITLPYNRHHFNKVVVVTTPMDTDTHQVADAYGADVFTTNSFYDNEATFNKWVALEEGLDWMGREGWLCIMDADIIWPKWIPDFQPKSGKIYTPKRKMLTDLSANLLPIYPNKENWEHLPYHRYLAEWSGYTQIFNSNDSVLGHPPWHEIDWNHAGGADSFFQKRWAQKDKLRPPFEVLHLGNSSENWCGRVTAYLDGSVSALAEKRRQKLADIFRNRRNPSKKPDFQDEKI